MQTAGVIPVDQFDSPPGMTEFKYCSCSTLPKAPGSQARTSYDKEYDFQTPSEITLGRRPYETGHDSAPLKDLRWKALKQG